MYGLYMLYIPTFVGKVPETYEGGLATVLSSLSLSDLTQAAQVNRARSVKRIKNDKVLYNASASLKR